MKIQLLHNKLLPGLLMVLVIAVVAKSLSSGLSYVDASVIAILIGILIKNFFGLPERYEAGVQFTLKKVLKAAIILLGFGLSFHQIFQVGAYSILIVVITVFLGITLTYYIGKMFGLHNNVSSLIGFGTAICGATAIITLGPLIRAKDEEVAYAINTIFGFNILAILVYPLIGLLMGMQDQQFGIWVATAVHDTSAVVAAGFAYSDPAGVIAVIVKLGRTMMIVPIALLILLIQWWNARKKGIEAENTSSVWKVFPYFIFIFVLAAFLNTIIGFPDVIVSNTGTLSKFLIIMVMASVGLGTDIKKLSSMGLKPLFVGLITSVLIGVISISLIFFFI